MDRVAHILTQAADLRRRIYASISFSERLAALFVRLSLDTIETLGKALGAEFLLRGVLGMPDPGPRWRPESRNPALTLPAGYMKGFAARLYGLLMKKFRDPALVEDAIQMYLARVTTSGEIKPMPLSAAESYVQSGVVRQALNLIRAQREQKRDVRQEESLSPAGEDERSIGDTLSDPHAMQDIHRELSPRVWKMWMQYLARHLHPDIPDYIGLAMQGYSNAEIIGDPKKGEAGRLPTYQVPPSGYAGSPFYRLVLRIPEVSRAFFNSIHEEMPTAP